MRTAAKVLIFAALIATYWAFDGFQPVKELGRLNSAFAAFYIVGAIVALCEGERIGTLDPISLRPIFIVIGSLMMIAAFIAMIATRESE